MREQPRKLEKLKAIEKELLIIEDAEKLALARENLLAFTLYTKPDYEVYWFNRQLCQALDDLVRGKIKKLMVFMAPRRGKSELVSRRLPAFALGRDPDEKIIACSYGGDLALMMSADVQNIIKDYRYQELFPKTWLQSQGQSLDAKKYKEQSDFFQTVDNKGYYRCAGVMGGITGMGATLAIIDDYHKDPKEAMSKIFRDRVWDWYRAAFKTRLEKNARQLITATRWHEDDLAGRLLKAEGRVEDGGEWTVLCFPEIKEGDPNNFDSRKPGECLWPERFWVTEESLIKDFGARFYAALFQQRPAPDKGEYFQRQNWRYYQTPPDQFDRIISVWDLNRGKQKQTGSYNCGGIWGKKGADVYMLWLFRERCGFTKSCDAIIEMKKARPQVGKIIVERAASGDSALDLLKSKVQGLVAKNPIGSKEARADGVQHIHEAQNCWLPDPKSAGWVDGYIEELATFPNGANDDQVDITVYALEELGGGLNLDFKLEAMTKQSKWKS